MRLYLVQHGDALPQEVDPDRPLSGQGRADIERLAALLASRVRVARVLHSGKTRAQQTADLLTPALASSHRPEAIAGIDPLDPPAPFADQVQRWSEDVLVVGAEEPGVVTFLPGSVVCLERTAEGRWTVAWMVRPELLA